jgi:NTE family protein
MKIGLALSGGGFRATVFHLGVLARLAEENRLEDVTVLSTNSGGTLCTGLVHTLNGFKWPTSTDYIEKVVPEARRLLTTKDLQRALIVRTLTSLWQIFETRSDDLSALMQEHWGITASLKDLPQRPRWMINATCHETGKNWRFERFRMGDYVFGYSHDTDMPLSDAMAASAGFPGAVGPLILDARERSWFKYERAEPEQGSALEDAETQRKWQTKPIKPAFSKVHLWDGGIYDNHGLEGVHDFVTGWRKNVDFLIVSDAAGRPKPAKYKRGVNALKRIVTDIMMDQIRSLRSRAILERLINHGDVDQGSFLQTGNTCRYVLAGAGRGEEADQLCKGTLSDEDANRAANMPTVIRKLKRKEFELLFRHGFEVADYTLYAYYADQFKYVGYSNSRWS